MNRAVEVIAAISVGVVIAVVVLPKSRPSGSTVAEHHTPAEQDCTQIVGWVHQVISDDSALVYTSDISPRWTDRLVYVHGVSMKNRCDGDSLGIQGEQQGGYVYKTTRGSRKTIPWLECRE